MIGSQIASDAGAPVAISLFAKMLSLFDGKERRHALAMLCMMLLGSFFEAIGVGLLFPVITILAEPAKIPETYLIGDLYRVAGEPRAGRFVLAVLGLLLFVFFIKNTYLAILSYWQNRFAQNKAAVISQRLFAAYMAQPYSFHLQRNSAELLRNLTAETSSLVGLVLLPLLMLFSEALTVVALVVVLLQNNLLAASVVIVLFSVTSFIFYRLIRTRILRWGQAYQKHSSLAIQHLQQGLGGIKDIAVLGCQHFFSQRFVTHSNESASYNGRQGFINTLPLLWLETLAVAVLLGLVAILLLQGKSFSVIIPTLGMFTAAAFRLMPSANRILVSLQNLRFCKPTVDVLYREIHNTETVKDLCKAEPITFRQLFELRNIIFCYPGSSKNVLDGFSLTIEKGESVGIVGSSGVGKTTLVDILLGLLRPSSGDMQVDGQSVLNRIAGWQRNLGYVPQSIYLTDDTLRRNVAFGLPDEQIDDAAVWRAVESAQLGEYVRSLADGLNTDVGERGVRLSGGQRQRIGIARALYHDPEFLVLDEATSALDSETEGAVVSAINSLHGRKTIVVVAHRLSTLDGCDRIVDLKKT